MLRVAVIGSGPAGVYTAGALVDHGAVLVDVLDRLPAPFGLVRYGVAPDHPKIKSISAALGAVLSDPAVRFLGNVELGDALSLADLHRHYDAVVVACGAAVDRRLGILGEDLAGSFSATDFVAWYSGHPDAPIDRFTLSAHSVVVLGMGNVALDVARMLATTAADLRVTDVPDHVLDVLTRSAVTDIHVIGRRGPLQARWTTKELRELGELAGADVLVDPGELQLDEIGIERIAGEAALRRNHEVLVAWAQRPTQDRPRRVHLRFRLQPLEVLGTDRVTGLRLEHTRLDAAGAAHGTGETTTLDAQMLLRSVGYRGVALPDLPFDPDLGVIPHEDGRVVRDGQVVPGTYVAGWIKRGPSGVIGTNKHDAVETVRSLLSDVATLERAPVRDPDALLALLAGRGVEVVPWAGWLAIDQAEKALGEATGRGRVKIAGRAELLRAAARSSSAST